MLIRINCCCFFFFDDIVHKIESKKDGEDQEMIYSSITPDPGNYMGR